MRWPFVVEGDEFRGEEVACSERRKPRRQNWNHFPSSLFLLPVMVLLSSHCHKRTCSVLGHFLLNTWQQWSSVPLLYPQTASPRHCSLFNVFSPTCPDPFFLIVEIRYWLLTLLFYILLYSIEHSALNVFSIWCRIHGFLWHSVKSDCLIEIREIQHFHISLTPTS